MNNQTNINFFPGHMSKTKRQIKEKLKLIDIVYEVIDARMPYSSKIDNIDEIIKDKPRILIFTKYDLCDQKETDKWINYYKKNNEVLKLDLTKNQSFKELYRLTDDLMDKINQKRANKGLNKRKARVLIIGVPNVGKSTLINRISNKKVTNTGNKPGITKNLSWIRINDKIELLDTPGILWPKLGDRGYTLGALSSIKEEVLPPFEITSYILNMYNKYYKNILKRYGLEELDEDMVKNIETIAKKRGYIFKGNEIDYNKTMNMIMNECRNGIIKGITFDRYEEKSNN